MRLLIKRGTSLINDLRFSKGPIFIGREPNCSVFLPDRAVSRKHAVIYSTANANWMVKDLESANKTTLNGRGITKMPLREGDIVGIADFTIEVHFENVATVHPTADPLAMEDTLLSMPSNIPSIYQTNRQVQQALYLTPERIRDFYTFNIDLIPHDDQASLIKKMIEILMKQFDAYHVWAGLRETTGGPMTCHEGSQRGGGAIELEGLLGRKIAQQAINNESYILIPNLTDITSSSKTSLVGMEQLRSAMAAPIASPSGVYGVIYLDNSIDQNPYTRQDLDYLTLVSIQVAAITEHIG